MLRRQAERTPRSRHRQTGQHGGRPHAAASMIQLDSVGDLGGFRCGSTLDGHVRVVPPTDAAVERRRAEPSDLVHGETLHLIENGGPEITAHGQGGPRTKVEAAQRTQNLDQRDGQHLSAEPDDRHPLQAASAPPRTGRRSSPPCRPDALRSSPPGRTKNPPPTLSRYRARSIADLGFPASTKRSGHGSSVASLRRSKRFWLASNPRPLNKAWA